MSRSSETGGVPALRLPSAGVLALDLASTVGWAYGLLDEPCPAFGVWRLAYVGGEGARYASLENELAAFIDRTQPGHVVVEASLSLAAFAQVSNYRVMCQQITLRGIVLMEAWRASSGISEIDAPTVRAEVMGQRRFSKDTVKREVVRWCFAHGLRVPDHNAGDACLTWLWYRARMLGLPPVAGPLFRDRAA
jgi:Holliday junction resolvasome RuvABC endonuclease subunit